MANITCGNCGGKHGSVAAVRNCHEAGTAAKATGGPAATEKQVAFIAKLAQERGVEFNTDGLTKAAASQAIENLLAMPKPAQPKAEELEDGIYFKDGIIFKVVHAVHGSGKQYAKQLMITTDGEKTYGSFEYAGRAPLATLTADDKLTAAKAKEYGLLYGMCVNCTKDLTKEESIHVGYGQTCAKNNGWYYPTKKELKELTAKEEAPASF